MNHSHRLKRLFVAAAIVAALAALPISAAPAVDTAPPPHLGTVVPGDGLVVESPRVADAAVFWEACGVAGECFEYTFDVAPGGRRLRVLLDSVDSADVWGFRVRTPAGRVVEALRLDPTELDRAAVATNVWTLEMPVIAAPEDGRYELLVDPVDVHDGRFRMRIQLDGEEVAPLGAQPPNLRVVPPWGLTFAAPVQQVRPPTGNTLTPTPLEVAGERPVSCLADETANDGVTRCLRFGIGVANDGDGPLDLRFNREQLEGSMTQQVRGEDEPRSGGPRYEIHLSHMHFHNQDMVTTELFRVVPSLPPTSQGRRAPMLEPAGSSTKHGFCLLDSAIVDVRASRSDPQSSEVGSCEIVDPNTDDPTTTKPGRMVLGRGWADYYPWYLPGMYVDFAGLSDGDYVLRSTADPNGRVYESREDDNVSYTWVRVVGDEVSVVERGYGSSPWDKGRVVIDSDWPI